MREGIFFDVDGRRSTDIPVVMFGSDEKPPSPEQRAMAKEVLKAIIDGRVSGMVLPDGFQVTTLNTLTENSKGGVVERLEDKTDFLVACFPIALAAITLLMLLN